MTELNGLLQQGSQWLSSLRERLPARPGQKNDGEQHSSRLAALPTGSASALPPGTPPLPTPRAFRPLTRDEIEKRLPVKDLPERTRFTLTPDEIRENPTKGTVAKEEAGFINMPWDDNNLLDPFSGH